MNDKHIDYRRVFENKMTTGASYWLYSIIGVVLFCLIFFVGWLIFDFFLGSLALGIFTLVYVLHRMLQISMEKNAYDTFTRKAREEAEQLGFDGEVSESMIEDALRVLGNSTSKQEAS